MYVRRYLRHLRPAYTEPRAFQILVLQRNFYSRHMSWADAPNSATIRREASDPKAGRRHCGDRK